MLYREIIAVCSQIHAKHTEMHCVGRLLHKFLMLNLAVHKVTIALQSLTENNGEKYKLGSFIIRMFQVSMTSGFRRSVDLYSATDDSGQPIGSVFKGQLSRNVGNLQSTLPSNRDERRCKKLDKDGHNEWAM